MSDIPTLKQYVLKFGKRTIWAVLLDPYKDYVLGLPSMVHIPIHDVEEIKEEKQPDASPGYKKMRKWAVTLVDDTRDIQAERILIDSRMLFFFVGEEVVASFNQDAWLSFEEIK